MSEDENRALPDDRANLIRLIKANRAELRQVISFKDIDDLIAVLSAPLAVPDGMDVFTLREIAKIIRKNADNLNDDYILYYLYSEAANLELKAREIENAKA